MVHGVRNVDPDNDPEFAQAFALTSDALADRAGDNVEALTENMIDTFMRINAPNEHLLA
ncbi:MAG: hypothetical protein ACPGRZ_02400 [Alphaproteobacteria bacterium]